MTIVIGETLISSHDHLLILLLPQRHASTVVSYGLFSLPTIVAFLCVAIPKPCFWQTSLLTGPSSNRFPSISDADKMSVVVPDTMWVCAELFPFKTQCLTVTTMDHL